MQEFNENALDWKESAKTLKYTNFHYFPIFINRKYIETCFNFETVTIFLYILWF